MIRYEIRRLEKLVEHLAVVLRGQRDMAPRPLQTARDVLDLLEAQVEAIRTDATGGTVEKARAIGYLANLARQALETGILAARLEKLEAELDRRKHS